jgi:hypothetical protein
MKQKTNINRTMPTRSEKQRRNINRAMPTRSKKQRRKQFLEVGLISQRMIGSREN